MITAGKNFSNNIITQSEIYRQAQAGKKFKLKKEKTNYERITGLTAALFLVLGIAATIFAQDTMKQDTMTKQDDQMMSKKPMMKKHRMTKKEAMMEKHRRHHKAKMMKKSTMMKKPMMKKPTMK